MKDRFPMKHLGEKKKPSPPPVKFIRLSIKKFKIIDWTCALARVKGRPRGFMPIVHVDYERRTIMVQLSPGNHETYGIKQVTGVIEHGRKR